MAGLPCCSLHVIAMTAADVVEYAGGWLFDHAIAGWKVTVLLADCADSRPIDILGADVADLESALTTDDLAEGPPGALVVAGALYGNDVRVQRFIRAAVDGGCADTLLWRRDPAVGDRANRSIDYALGAAARAFKAEAAAAAGISATAVKPTEVFSVIGGRRSQRSVEHARRRVVVQG